MNEILPIHVAIIMDGNRRWAKKHKVNPIEGHRKGVDTLIKIVEEAVRIGIKYLTVYALSTENLKNRTKSEVLALLKLIEEGFTKHLQTFTTTKKGGSTAKLYWRCKDVANFYSDDY